MQHRQWKTLWWHIQAFAGWLFPHSHSRLLQRKHVCEAWFLNLQTLAMEVKRGSWVEVNRKKHVKKKSSLFCIWIWMDWMSLLSCHFIWRQLAQQSFGLNIQMGNNAHVHTLNATWTHHTPLSLFDTEGSPYSYPMWSCLLLSPWLSYNHYMVPMMDFNYTFVTYEG